jgi:TolB-like protein
LAATGGYKMKKTITLIGLLLVTLSVYGQANKPVQLDTALMVAAERIDARITAGSKIAVLNFNSKSDKFSSYVIDELIAYLVDSGTLKVIDRKEIDLIRGEQNFQYSGDVDDASMVDLGRMLGAQSIVSGSLTEIDNTYRIVIRVLNVQTAAVEVQYRAAIIGDRKVKSLLSIEKTTGQKIGTGALNIIFGLGSYLEGDIADGITITAGYTLAAGLFAIEAVALDWDNPAVGVPATLGVTVAGLTFVYGFVRPFIYNHSPQLASVMDNTNFKIVQLPDSSTGSRTVYQLSYSIKF